MYIFIKIHDNKNGNGEKPFIIEESNMEIALDKLFEKYYNMKFTSIMTVIHYPHFLNILNIIKGL